VNNHSIDQVKLYPNPVKKGFTLEHPLAAANGVLGVFNLAGVEMAKQPVLKGTSQTYVSIAQLPAGMYIVRYKANEELISQKIIKH
ncbi:MAG: T9SS type A sorting domain-containing protein, partial [Chitinophagaceae bacterium]